MDFRLVHAEYDRETERAYVELRLPTTTAGRRSRRQSSRSGQPGLCPNGKSKKAHRAAGRCGASRVALAAVPAWADLQSLWLERLAVQHLRSERPLYVARPSAHLRCGRPAAQAAADAVPAKNGLKAARLALVGEREGWIPAFSRAVFVANYAQQKDISDDGTLRTILAALGVDAEAALAAANAPETTAEQSGVLYTTADTEQDLVDALEKTLDCPMISQRDLAPPRGLAQR